MIVYGSSGRTPATRASTSPAARVRPRSRNSSSEIVPSTPGSIETMASSLGSSSRTATSLATWDASSQIAKRDSEFPATHAHSSGELVG